MKKEINKIFEEQKWFEHIDCTEENCILTFIENNYDKFECKHIKSCNHSWLCRELGSLKDQITNLTNKQVKELRLFRMVIDGLLEKIDNRR